MEYRAIGYALSILHRLDRDRAVTEYTDFKIVCEGKTFDVHRVVLGAASEYFDKMFGSSFKEANTGMVIFDEVPADHMEIILNHLYRNCYNPQSVATHVAIYVLADRFCIESLMASVIESLDELMSSEDPNLLEHIIEAVELLWYYSVPAHKGLRRPVLAAAVKHKDKLLGMKAFEDLLIQGGDFVPRYIKGAYEPRWGGFEDPNEPA
ncbi:hypothetical protein MMC17_009682 [Xylographa soralifera]|nr:hypothetical protein [Xylographa soralifera]